MTASSLTVVGDQQLVVNASALRLTLPTNAAGVTIRPTHALIFVGNGNGIRWLGGNAAGDGVKVSTTPTASIGIYVGNASYIDWTDPNGNYYSLIRNSQFIGASGAATLDIVYMA